MDILNIDPRVLIVQIGAFIILLLVFKWFLFKPILGMIDTRRSEIDKDYQDAKVSKESADAMKVEYEKQLNTIKEQADGKMAEALAEANTAKNEILESSHKEAQHMLESARNEISEEKDPGRQQYRQY